MVEKIVIGIILVSLVYLVGGIVRYFLFNKKKNSLKFIFTEFYYLNHIVGLVTIALVVLLWKIVVWLS